MTSIHSARDERDERDERDDDDVIAAAAAWVIRLEADDASAEDRASFEHWLQQSTLHPAQFARAQRSHLLAQALAGDELLRAELHSARRAPVRQARWRWPAGIAAALAVLLVPLLVLQPWRPSPEHFATAIGERRDVTLEDGSRLVLDTDTEISVRFTHSERQLQLLRGQAQFTVGADPRRPLVVTTDDVWIRDIGTTFQVRRAPDGVDVALLDGKVDIGHKGSSTAQASLTPGQQARVDPQGRIQIGNTNIDALHAWTQGTLLVERQRLDRVLAEMNRYRTQPLRLADTADGTLLISGRFNVQDQQAFLAALDAGWSLTSRPGDHNEIVLYRRRQSN
ncbi:hypothetical protein DI041_05480 [Stenotrophomonas maltophilia]|uniref:FecR family protein n=1 Tax=Stenotrophomonas maltophilia TaxID=40324 RepID=UPI0010AA5F3D|nr:FecR domain-containing protein [Stenotrophomonas maltophilia]TIE19505.1 hypothetical protein DI034_05255 [Stenotrophomonas maltophilia]TIE63038.1 hypothetical protein DI041_05480 [Stenotrophomonas maltophilia]